MAVTALMSVPWSTAMHATPVRTVADEFSPDAAACAAMTGREIGPGRVNVATFNRPPYYARWYWDPERVTVHVPFCRLEGVATPARHSYIAFEVWLPEPRHWNGRLLGVGAGNSQGSVNNVLLAMGVNRGFASVATDNGHHSSSSFDANQWALGEPERIVDFGYRANHLAAQAARIAVRHLYGKPQSRAYFYGCSQGGHKAMMEAERFPDDYDGIVAGAPVYSWGAEMTLQAWGVKAFSATPGSLLTPTLMRAMHAAVLKKCGAENGLVMDPRQCKFNPVEMQCPRTGAEPCLTPEQINAVNRLYDGPQLSNGGTVITGMSRGSEGEWDQYYGEVSADGSRGGGSFFGFLKNMVFNDPAWTLQKFDLDRDWPLVQRMTPMLDANTGDLSAFAKRGGKLVIYHGWADQQVPAQSSVDYRNAVLGKARPPGAGADATSWVDGYLRLFMVPGMHHCFLPPPGPNLVVQDQNSVDPTTTPERDVLTALQAWVEKDVAPERFDVRLEDPERQLSARTVRVCREPLTARYSGQGDPLQAENWDCH